MNILYLKNYFVNFRLELSFLEVNYELPINYAYRYDILKAILEKEELLFIKEKRSGSLKSFVDQAEYISTKANLPYVLIFSSLSDIDKATLTKSRIPFLDYKGNMFIPKLGLYLKKEVERLIIEKFTPSEQVIIISLLLNEMIDSSIDELSGATDISIPTIYRSFKKFIDSDLMIKINNEYKLKYSKKDVFEKAFNYFDNPVIFKQYIPNYELINNHNELLTDSGIKALSNITNLASNEDSKAIDNKKFRKFNISKINNIFDENLLNLKCIEVWKYEPRIFKDKDIIDPISLYFSLEDNIDPRVQNERNELLNYIYLEMEG